MSLQGVKLARPFLQLPFRFDAEVLAQEALRHPAGAWMEHPSGLAGNSALPLVSRKGGNNHDFGGHMVATPHLEASPYTRAVMASFDEVLARSRLMRLEPGCEVAAHVDFNYHWYSRVRVHVPVRTEPGVQFHCDDEVLHMEAGSCWLFDNWRRHRVVHGGLEPRIHLVIDLTGSARFWSLVRALEGGEAPEVRVLEATSSASTKVLRTERFSQAPVLAPGELGALIADLIEDFSSHPANDPKLVARYRSLLEDFAREWRIVWLEYGPTTEAVPRYQRLITIVQRNLHPERRALVMASNDVGVNPVIVQRILRAALAPELFPDWQAP